MNKITVIGVATMAANLCRASSLLKKLLRSGATIADGIDMPLASSKVAASETQRINMGSLLCQMSCAVCSTGSCQYPNEIGDDEEFWRPISVAHTGLACQL
jgi:hypothetical protein